ncbi:hypothetical protein LTR56_013543 [Elasticomyces elasticus]|nr:hypothetical protein LTR56_013543 [Elasticomyces elasticus]KAK3651007.1 hypothetical protein LTR22_012255 [Elasticomyces elasticus]KAK4931085.1 hypothetical protein LTR49_002501 [Elasticomyces elasticus]KAK5765553.1 hypothetical protein LTS12_004305 [Elasticomyces elasticus]
MAAKPPSCRSIAWKRLCGKELTPAEKEFEERRREIAKQQRLIREERAVETRLDNIRNGRPSCASGWCQSGREHECGVMQMDRQHNELMKKLGELEAKIERLGACRCPDTREHLKAKREKKEEIYKAEAILAMLAKRREFLEQGSLNLAVDIMNPRPLCKGRHWKELDHQCIVAQLTQQHEQVIKKLEELDAKIERCKWSVACRVPVLLVLTLTLQRSGEDGDKTSSTGM